MVDLFKRKPEPDVFTFGVDGGEKKQARVSKLTYTKFRALNEASGVVPLIVLHTIEAMKSGDFVTYMLSALNELGDEVYNALAIITDIDVEWLKDNAGMTEVIQYLIATAKKNDFGAVLKNVQSLLPQNQA